ncbi:UNVERIFIED_CONTAM: hypothetical protein FKN15_076204 [Acipenser sinensis]
MEVRNPLPQSLEDSNLTKALRLRERIAADITRRLSQRPSIHHLRSLHQHSVHLCGYKSSSVRCRDLIKESLCDPRLLRCFEDSQGLNWSKQARRLFPLKNPGKNNSLLDAVSLYMWGVCDADSVLHVALYRTLAESSEAELRLAAPRRAARYRAAHLPPDSGFCAEEWQNIVKMANPKAKAEMSLIHFYQDIYLHVLANIIRRPIIVIAGSSKESSSVSSDAVPNPAGVYLPLLWESDECCHFPVVLGYSSHHFTPLVNVHNPGAEMDALPLVMPTAYGMVALPAPFLPDSEQRTKQQFLNKYLNITAVYLEGNVTETVFAARLQGNNLPDDLSLVQDYFKLVHHTCRQIELTTESKRAQDVSRKQENRFSPPGLSITADNCLTSGCLYFCSKFTQPFCHQCFKDFQSKGPPPRSCHSHQESRRQDRKENSSDRTTFYGNASPSEVKLPTGPASAPAASSNLSFFNEVSVQNRRTPRPGKPAFSSG